MLHCKNSFEKQSTFGNCAYDNIDDYLKWKVLYLNGFKKFPHWLISDSQAFSVNIDVFKIDRENSLYGKNPDNLKQFFLISENREMNEFSFFRC